MTLAIHTAGLTKRFRSGQVAVDDLTLEVPQGSVFGFLGPNGSGKTTTIRLLLGLLQPTRGEAWVLDEPIGLGGSPVLDRVGALVEGPAFHPYLSGAANLARLQSFDRTQDAATASERATQALERVGLSNAARKKYRQYSLGMKQRLGLAAALMRPRDVLILDEPTNGLDPQGTREVRQLVRDLASDGTTVLVSSHLLTEIEQICTDVAIMSQGSLLFQGTMSDLRRRGRPVVVVRATTDTCPMAVQTLTGLGMTDVEADGDTVTADLGDRAAEDVSRALVEAGVGVTGFEVRSAQLEDLFVELTGEGFDVAR